MARLITSGLELGTLLSSESTSAPDGQPTGFGITIDTSTPRLGLGAAQTFIPQVSPNNANRTWALTASGTTLFARFYLRMNGTQNIGEAIEIFTYNNGPAFILRYAATSNNNFETLVGNTNNSSNFIIQPIIGTWVKIEVRLKIGVGATDEFDLYFDDVLHSSLRNVDAGIDVLPTLVSIGPNFSLAGGTAGANSFSIDDFSLNDDSGSQQNSWCGPGKIVLAVPTSDSAVGTGWTDDNAAVTNLFNSVNKKPPLGIADTTAGGGGHQIRNATSNANVNYDAVLPAYTSLGVSLEDQITVLVPITATGAPVTTSAKAGTIGLASNPSIPNIALGAGGTAGAFWSGVAAGTYPTGWKWSYGTTVYNPSVLPGTSPVIRVTQVTSSTRIAMVDFLGMYVEFTPVKSTTLPPATPILVRLVRGMGGKLRRLHENILVPDFQAGPPTFVYVDSATISSVTSLASIESTDFVDVNTIASTSSVSATEVAADVDADTISSTTAVSSVDTTDFVDAGTPASITSLTSTELYTPYIDRAFATPLLITLGEKVKLFRLLNDNILGETPQTSIQYTDAATISSATSVQSSESIDFIDTAGTINGTSSVTSSELSAYLDADTVSGVSSVSATDVAADLDADTPVTVTSITSTELFTPYIDRSFVTPLLITLGERIKQLRLSNNSILGEIPPHIPVQYTDSDTPSSVTTVVTPSIVLVSDTFSRTVSPGWGTADLGGNWTLITGSTSDFDVDGTAGRFIKTGSLGFLSEIVLPSVSAVDFDVTGRMKTAATPIGSSTEGCVELRYQSATARYVCRIFFLPGGSAVGRIERGSTTIGSPATGINSVPSGSWVRFRAQAIGTTIQMKIWLDGDPEPSAWLISLTDSIVTGAGAFGVSGVQSAGNTNTPFVSFDDLLVISTLIETAQYVESATITGNTSVSSAEQYVPLDSATVSSQSTVISSDIYNVVDPSTGTTVTSVISLETADFVDSGTISGITTPSSTDVAAYVDSSTVGSITSISATELHEIPDTGTVSGTTVVTSADIAAYVDSNTISSTTLLTYTETVSYVDSDTPASITSISSSDAYLQGPVPSSIQALLIRLARYHRQLKLLGSNTLASPPPAGAVYTESATISTTTSVVSNEVAAYTDSNTVTSKSVPSSTDTTDFVDAIPVAGKTSVSTTDTAAYLDAATVNGTTAPSSVDIATYVDSALILSTTSTQPVESFIEVDAATVTNRTIASSSDIASYVDSFTAFSVTSVLSTETTDYVDTDRASSITTISYTEEQTAAPTFNDFATITSITSLPHTYEYGPIVQISLIGTTTHRWDTTNIGGRYSIEFNKKRWFVQGNDSFVRWLSA